MEKYGILRISDKINKEQKNVEFCDILIATHRKDYGNYRYH